MFHWVALVLTAFAPLSIQLNCVTYDAVLDVAVKPRSIANLRVFAANTAPIVDAQMRSAMRRFCGVLDSELTGRTCCGKLLVRHMNRRLAHMQTLMGANSEECFSSYSDHVCRETCDSKRTNRKKIKQYILQQSHNKWSNSDMTIFTDYRVQVVGILHYMSPDLLEDLFHKCSSNKKLSSRVCDPDVAIDCTPLHWLQLLTNRMDQPPWNVTYALLTKSIQHHSTNQSSYSNRRRQRRHKGMRQTRAVVLEMESGPRPGMHHRKGVRTLNPPRQLTHPYGYWPLIVYMFAIILTCILLKMWRVVEKNPQLIEKVDPLVVLPTQIPSAAERFGEYIEQKIKRMLIRTGIALATYPLQLLTIVILFATILAWNSTNSDQFTVPFEQSWAPANSTIQRHKEYMRKYFVLLPVVTLARQEWKGSLFPSGFQLCSSEMFMYDKTIRSKLFPKFSLTESGFSICHRLPSHQHICHADVVGSKFRATRNLEPMIENVDLCLRNMTADGCISESGNWVEPEDVIMGYDERPDLSIVPAPGQHTYAYQTSVFRIYLKAYSMKAHERMYQMSLEFDFDIRLFKNVTIYHCPKTGINLINFNTWRTPAMEPYFYKLYEAIVHPTQYLWRIVFALLFMFVYASIVLRQGHFRTLLAFGMVVVQWLSIFSPFGLLAIFGEAVPSDVYIVMPAIILSFGADNMMVIAFVEQFGSLRHPDTKYPAHIGAALGECGPVILMHLLTSAAIMFLSAWSFNPYARQHAFTMGICILLNGVLQLMVIVALLTLDCERIDNERCDPLLCCYSSRTQDLRYGIFDIFVEYIWMPIMMHRLTRVLIAACYMYSLCISLHELYFVPIGDDVYRCLEKMPAQNAKFHEYVTFVGRVGPEMYVVVRGDIDYSVRSHQNIVLGSLAGNESCGPSIMDLLIKYDQYEYHSYVYYKRPRNWLHWFMAWQNDTECCWVHAKSGIFCNNLLRPVEDYKDDKCNRCDIAQKLMDNGRIRAEYFHRYLEWYLTAPASNTTTDRCIYSGEVWSREVRYIGPNRLVYFIRLFHKHLNTTSGHVHAIRATRLLAKYLTHALRVQYHGAGTMTAEQLASIEVFIYSPDYVMYEQFIDIVWTGFYLAAIALIIIWIVHWLLNGLNGTAAVLVTFVSFCISVQMAALLVKVQLTPLSLMYTLQSFAVGVYFCSLTLWAWTHSMQETNEERLKNVILVTAHPMWLGIVCTKLFGLMLLWCIDNEYYFHIGFYMFIVATTRGILLMPALLLLFGPTMNRAKKLVWRQAQLRAKAEKSMKLQGAIDDAEEKTYTSSKKPKTADDAEADPYLKSARTSHRIS